MKGERIGKPAHANGCRRERRRNSTKIATDRKQTKQQDGKEKRQPTAEDDNRIVEMYGVQSRKKQHHPFRPYVQSVRTVE